MSLINKGIGSYPYQYTTVYLYSYLMHLVDETGHSTLRVKMEMEFIHLFACLHLIYSE